MVYTQHGFFVVTFIKYRLYMRFIVLLASTIMVKMGLTCYHGIYTTWIFVVPFPKYRSIYEFTILLAGTIMVTNGIDSLSWSCHGFSSWLCRFIFELRYHIGLIAIGLTHYHAIYTTWIFGVALLKYMDDLCHPPRNYDGRNGTDSILVYTQHGISLWYFQNTGLYIYAMSPIV
jgi:hypothetical protein